MRVRVPPAILDPGVKHTLLDGTMMSWKDLVEVLEDLVGLHLSWLTGQSQHVTKSMGKVIPPIKGLDGPTNT